MFFVSTCPLESRTLARYWPGSSVKRAIGGLLAAAAVAAGDVPRADAACRALSSSSTRLPMMPSLPATVSVKGHALAG